MKRNSRFFVSGVAAFTLMMTLVLAGCIDSMDPGLGSNTVATPTANPQAGAVTSSTAITLSTATNGTTIYYTIDGSTPSASSTEYSNTDKPTITTATTIKAIAVLGWSGPTTNITVLLAM